MIRTTKARDTRVYGVCRPVNRMRCDPKHVHVLPMTCDSVYIFFSTGESSIAGSVIRESEYWLHVIARRCCCAVANFLCFARERTLISIGEFTHELLQCTDYAVMNKLM
jgi:hypothetical protein